MAAGHSGLGKLMQWSRSRSSSSRSSQDSVTDPEEVHVPSGDEIKQLHAPKSPEALKKVLVENTGVDLNAIEPSLQQAPLHSILKGNRSERNRLLETLLMYGDVDVNLTDLDGMYPLHLAIKNNDIPSIKILIAFGANVNAVSGDNQTPTGLSKAKVARIYLKRLESWTGISVDDDDSNFGFTVVPRGFDPKFSAIDENATSVPQPNPPELGTAAEPRNLPAHDVAPSNGASDKDIVSSVNQSTVERSQSREEVESEITQLLKSVGGTVRINKKELTENGQKIPPAGTNKKYATNVVSYDGNVSARRLYKQLDDELKKQMNDLNSISDIDGIVASTKQRKELVKFKKTGSRILCMDGGGMKALVELDVLESIERESGKQITELFDWIVGTSTGGILALGLVYGKKSIKELRRLCLQLKDEVFANPKFGISYNSEALEKMLINALGPEMRMGDITHPKVMVAAVHKGSTPLKVHLFNNCLEDDLSNEVVWKVARSTCAGPMLFSEFNNYVDGGVLCNNPTERGVTTIQNYHWEKGEKLPISLIVSVGSGVYPEEKLGSVDAQDLSLKNMGSLKDRVTNLLGLFRNALVESETVAATCDRNFKEQGIPYYRFSPNLLEAISTGETDSRKLIDSVITTRQQTFAKIKEMVSDNFHK